MKKSFKFLTIIFTFSFLIFNFTGLAHAQVSLVVSPPKVDLKLKPGETAQQAIKITNQTNQPITVKLSVQDFLVQDNHGTPVKVSQDEAGRFLASPWFHLDRTEFTIQPQKTEVVTVLITTPKNALPGGHYAAVYVEPQLGHKPKSTGPKIVSEVGSLFSLTIQGDVKYDALIHNFRTSKRFFEFGPIDFFAEVENLSDTHISPQPSIVIKNMLGQTIANLPLEKVNIFPLASRFVTGKWERVWGLGKYQATLNIPFGPGKVTSATIFFWIVPWRLLLAILILLLTFIATYILVRRHLKSKHDPRDEEIDQLKRRLAELENKL